MYFFDRKDFFYELHALTDLRNKLGIRTGLNSIERLLNPANSDTAFLGVFHKPFMQKYAKIFSKRYKKLIIIKGNEGTSEIYSKTQYWIVQGDSIGEYRIDPNDFGIKYQRSWDNITLEHSLRLINNPDDELIKIAKLNASLVLFSLNIVKNIQEGYEQLQNTSIAS